MRSFKCQLIRKHVFYFIGRVNCTAGEVGRKDYDPSLHLEYSALIKKIKGLFLKSLKF